MDVTLATRDELPILDEFVRYPGVLVGHNLHNYDFLGIRFKLPTHLIYTCKLDNDYVGVLVLNTVNRHIEAFSVNQNEKYKGQKLWKPMMEYLIANHADKGLYGETSTEDEPMAHILKKYGFVHTVSNVMNRQGWWL